MSADLRTRAERLHQRMVESIVSIRHCGDSWFGWRADAQRTADIVRDLLAALDAAEQARDNAREGNLSLSASHSNALAAIDAERRANERADAAEQREQALRAQLAKLLKGA